MKRRNFQNKLRRGVSPVGGVLFSSLTRRRRFSVGLLQILTERRAAAASVSQEIFALPLQRFDLGARNSRALT